MKKQKVSTKNTFSIITLGCSKNTVDSEVLAGSLLDNGFKYTDNILDSQYVIINTCGFIKPAINQSIDTIKNIIDTIKENKVNSKVIVTGCLVSRYKEHLLNKLNKNDGDLLDNILAFYDTKTFLDIPKDLLNLEKENKIIDNKQYKKFNGVIKTSSIIPDYSSKLSKFVSTSYYSYIKIGEGCNHTCSFCAIPLIRGKYKSRPIEDIVQEVKKIVSIGIKEVILVSQDTSFYGYDIYGKLSLDRLLYSISELDGDFWIRMLYLYPTTLTSSAMKVINESDKIVKYIDIPFQHVSERVLKAMRRPGNESFYRDFVWKIRNTIDNVVIRSTFIVGHPMEEEEDFNQLLRFLEDVKIERAGFFKYYREKGTLSYSLPQVNYKIKNRRYKTISSLQDKVLKSWSEKQIGKVFKVLVESEEDNYYIGRAYFDAPEVDSTIKILKNKTLKNKGRKNLLGNFCNVKIISFEEYDFYGECVS